MSRPRLFLAWVDDLDTPFVRATHAVPGSAEFELNVSEVRKQFAKISVRARNTGHDWLAEDRKRAALISYTPTGAQADAVLMARSRLVAPLPTETIGSQVTLNFACSPEDGDRLTREWAVANLQTGDAYNRLCVNNTVNSRRRDPEDISAEALLSARSEDLHFHPATHAISTTDIIEGDRLISLGRSWLTKFPPSASWGEGAVTKVKLRATIAFVQEWRGVVNIGSKIFPFGAIGPANFVLNGMGWTKANDSVPQPGQRLGWEFNTGLTFKQKYEVWGTRKTGYETRPVVPGEGGGFETVTDLTSPIYEVMKLYEFDREHTLREEIYTNVYSPHTKFEIAGSYSQPRVEDIYVEVEIDAPVLNPVEATLDLGTIAVGDIYDDPDSDPWEQREYEKGETSQFNGRVYAATRTHLATSFYQQINPGLVTRPGFNGITSFDPHPMWREVLSGAAASRPELPSFSDRDAGQALMRYLVLVGRKEILERLRAFTAVFTFRWEDVFGLTLRDCVQVEGPRFGRDGKPIAGAYVEYRGKVIGLDWNWGRDGATCAVTIGVCVGTGGDDREPGAGSGDGYADLDLFEPGEDDASEVAVDLLAGDTAWAWTADPLRRPIDGSQLRNPAYIANVKIFNFDAQQVSEAINNMRAGGLKECAATVVDIDCIDLVSEGSIGRDYDVSAKVLVSPQGINLTGGPLQ